MVDRVRRMVDYPEYVFVEKAANDAEYNESSQQKLDGFELALKKISQEENREHDDPFGSGKWKK